METATNGSRERRPLRSILDSTSESPLDPLEYTYIEKPDDPSVSPVISRGIKATPVPFRMNEDPEETWSHLRLTCDPEGAGWRSLGRTV